MNEQDIDLQDPRGLHRGAKHRTDRDPGVAAEVGTRAQAARSEIAAGTVTDPLQEQA